MLISIGVYIWNTGRGSSVAAEQRRIAAIVQEQNTKFSQYIGEIYGSEVENCIRRVVSYNNNNAGNKITVIVTRKGGSPVEYKFDADVVNDITATNIVKGNIPDTVRNNLFTGTITTNIETGMIQSISFEEK